MKEFEANPQPSSAVLVRKRPEDVADEPVLNKLSKRKSEPGDSDRKKSRFAQKREAEGVRKPDTRPVPTPGNVLTDIVEKSGELTAVPPPVPTDAPFPHILKLDTITQEPKVRQRSLFAQQFMRMKQTMGQDHEAVESRKASSRTVDPSLACKVAGMTPLFGINFSRDFHTKKK